MWKNPINNETNLPNRNNQEILMGKDCTMIHHQGPKKWLTGSSTGSTSSRSSAVKPSVELCFPGVCNNHPQLLLNSSYLHQLSNYYYYKLFVLPENPIFPLHDEE
jgi:hypothetical protein